MHQKGLSLRTGPSGYQAARQHDSQQSRDGEKTASFVVMFLKFVLSLSGQIVAYTFCMKTQPKRRCCRLRLLASLMRSKRTSSSGSSPVLIFWISSRRSFLTYTSRRMQQKRRRSREGRSSRQLRLRSTRRSTPDQRPSPKARFLLCAGNARRRPVFKTDSFIKTGSRQQPEIHTV